MVAPTLPAVLPATKSLTQFCSLTFCEAGILSLAVVLPSFLSLICEPTTILSLAFVTLILISFVEPCVCVWPTIVARHSYYCIALWSPVSLK